MAVRAKFRCNSVRLTRATANTAEYDALLAELGLTYGNKTADDEAAQRGIERYRTFDQPTVELNAVADGSDENKAFFSATPNATISMSISNPDAAETFELGRSYYADFTPAP